VLRLGSNLFHMRNIRAHDILFSRLKLLVVMAKAYLEGNDFSIWRLRSMIRNTKYLSAFMANWNEYLTNFTSNQTQKNRVHVDHIFCQRVSLLAIMLNSFAEGNPMGIHRKLALKNNVEYIGEVLNHMHCISRTRLVVIK